MVIHEWLVIYHPPGNKGKRQWITEAMTLGQAERLAKRQLQWSALYLTIVARRTRDVLTNKRTEWQPI